MIKSTKIILISVLLSLIIFTLTVFGILEYYMVPHHYIRKLFIGSGDGNLGWYFLICFICDFILFFLGILVLTLLRTKLIKHFKDILS